MEIYHISNTTGSANAIPLGSYKRLVYHCLPSGWWVHIGECLPRVHHKCSEHVVCAIPEIVKVELFAGTSLQKGFLQVSENKAAVPAWTAAKSLDRSVSSSEFRFPVRTCTPRRDQISWGHCFRTLPLLPWQPVPFGNPSYPVLSLQSLFQSSSILEKRIERSFTTFESRWCMPLVICFLISDESY